MLSTNITLSVFNSFNDNYLNSILSYSDKLFSITEENVILSCLCIAGVLVSAISPINIDISAIHTLPTIKYFLMVSQCVLNKLVGLSKLFSILSR